MLTGLTSALISDIEYEYLLTCLRRYFLLTDNYDPEAFLPFLCALAEQCDLNEYIYACTEEELKKIDELEKGLSIPDDPDTRIMAKVALIK